MHKDPVYWCKVFPKDGDPFFHPSPFETLSIAKEWAKGFVGCDNISRLEVFAAPRGECISLGERVDVFAFVGPPEYLKKSHTEYRSCDIRVCPMLSMFAKNADAAHRREIEEKDRIIRKMIPYLYDTAVEVLSGDTADAVFAICNEAAESVGMSRSELDQLGVISVEK